MPDLSYAHAVRNLRPPTEVILGPCPCRTCGQLVSWAGVAWLEADTLAPHECAWRLEPGAVPARRIAPRSAGAHLGVVPVPEPAWSRRLGGGIVWATVLLAVLFGLQLLPRLVAAWS